MTCAPRSSSASAAHRYFFFSARASAFTAAHRGELVDAPAASRVLTAVSKSTVPVGDFARAFEVRGKLGCPIADSRELPLWVQSSPSRQGNNLPPVPKLQLAEFAECSPRHMANECRTAGALPTERSGNPRFNADLW